MDLSENIRILFDLEKNNYMMTRTIQNLYRKWNSIILEVPQHAVYHEPEKPDKLQRSPSFFYNLKTSFLFCVLTGLGVAIGVGFVTYFLAAVFEYLWDIPPLVIYSIPVLVFFAVVIGITLHYFNEDKQKYEEVKTRYESDLKQYHINIQAEPALYEKKYSAYLQKKKEKEVLGKEINSLNLKLQQSKAFLSKCYEQAEIDPDYRNIVPLGHMYQLIRLNVSNQLEGPNGLYYLVRKELRYDSFHHQLSDISQKLDQMIDNQSMLYSELRSINNQCDKIANTVQQQAIAASKTNESIEHIVNSSQITAYNTRRMQIEQQYAMDLRITSL